MLRNKLRASAFGSQLVAFIDESASFPHELNQNLSIIIILPLSCSEYSYLPKLPGTLELKIQMYGYQRSYSTAALRERHRSPSNPAAITLISRVECSISPSHRADSFDRARRLEPNASKRRPRHLRHKFAKFFEKMRHRAHKIPPDAPPAFDQQPAIAAQLPMAVS
jgi:hypothetical protein